VCRCGAGLGVEIGEEHRRAVRREVERDRAADPARRARHERALAGEIGDRVHLRRTIRRLT